MSTSPTAATEQAETFLTALMKYCENTEGQDDMKPLAQYEETLPLQAFETSCLGYAADAPIVG